LIRVSTGRTWETIYLKKIVLVSGGNSYLSSSKTRVDGFQFERRNDVNLAQLRTTTFIQVDDNYYEINRYSPTFWDLFNNTWGIAILLFDLVIFRISRWINLRVKAMQSREEK
jgi:hypothetical protein